MRWFKARNNLSQLPGESKIAAVPLEHIEKTSEDQERLKRWGPVRLAWAMPNYGPIFSPVYASHLATIAVASRYMTVEFMGKIPMIGATDRCYIHIACNNIVEECQQAGMTHIFWTESDMLLPVDTIPKLLEMDKDIAAGVYFLRGGEGQPCLYKRTPVTVKENPYVHTPIRVYDERGPFKVDCPGMGCVLMKLSLFDKLEEPFFDLKASRKGMKDGYGQDLYFFSKTRWAGIETWVNPDVVCDQIDTYTIGYKDYRKYLLEKQKNRDGFIAFDGHAIDS